MLRWFLMILLRIAVCDDDSSILNFMKQYLQKKNEQLQEGEISISLYKSGADFLSDVERGIAFNMVFMDIEIDIDGVEIGKTLRSRREGKDTILIYISRHKTRFEELVGIYSFGFVTKPINENMNTLNEIFDRGLEKMIRYHDVMASSKVFQYQVRGEKRYVNVDKILYLKNTLSWVSIYTWNATEKIAYVLDTFYAKMSNLIEHLPKDEFVFCERSHIVNLHYVREMADAHLILKDKEETQIPISTRRITDTKKAYIAFFKGGAAWKRIPFD